MHWPIHISLRSDSILREDKGFEDERVMDIQDSLQLIAERARGAPIKQDKKLVILCLLPQRP